MFCVGLTGGIGSGKTTVSNIFQQLGVTIVDTDTVAREIVTPGSDCLQKITNHYGKEILNDSGELNRKALREIIFTDAKEKLWLEALMHPIIRTKTREQITSAKSSYVILSSPLLLESPDADLCHRICVVDLSEKEQISRTEQRDGVSAQQIESTIAAQMTRNERLIKADDVIDNSGGTDETQKQVSELHEQYLKLAKNYER